MAPAVTLNADLGEGFGQYSLGDDEGLMPLLDLANVACGFHAGDPSVMSRTIAAARRSGVAVGAHPSYPDREGFGRREMKLAAGELRDLVLYQVGSLTGFLRREGLPLSHVKPHGSLYGVTSRDPQACAELLDAVATFGVPLVGLAGTCHESAARERGVPFLPEFFADLGYDAAGRLVITRSHPAVEPGAAAARVLKALRTGRVTATDGCTEVPVAAATVCVHSDTPGALAVARAVRAAVDAFNRAEGRPAAGLGPAGKPRTVLGANRGEVALRILRTCKKLGFRTVAISTPPDELSPHTVAADAAEEVESYTSSQAVLEAARAAGADAIFPGYGFLSENAAFARAVEDAGLRWIGPAPKTVEQFGLKHEARRIAEGAGVPVVPGSGLLASPEAALREAACLGFPVMLKATGGGGGIGMQRCADEGELEAAFVRCSHLAGENFAHPGLYLERYYPRSRHIEVQVFGDGEGQVVHMGERECSIQRRNQKVVEETPSPFLHLRPDLRAELCDAAVRLAKTARYRSAGTVEFLVVDEGEGHPDTGKYFFLEMNTRLQVEHGITELVTGEDIVGMMVRFAWSDVDPFPIAGRSWQHEGHAIEVRVYAENPTRDFQPSPGLLTAARFAEGPHVRVDTWVSAGTTVPPVYDPLLAKVMDHGPTRPEAIGRMSAALAESTIAGPPTNLAFLEAVVASGAFAAGATTTGFLQGFRFRPASLDVLQGGAATTVQDHPARLGLRVFGIQSSGPADPLAFQAANVLVGNAAGAPALEFAVRGPKLLFHQSRNVAVTGAAWAISIQEPGQPPVAKASWSRFHVPAGATLAIGSRLKQAEGGGVGYLAVEGAVSTPEFLGSCSTSMVYGGVQGRALKAGDVVPLGGSETAPLPEMSVPGGLVPQYTHHWEILVLPGPHGDPTYMTREDVETFLTVDWEVHHNSGRTGVRLLGPRPAWARRGGGRGGSHPSNVHDCGYALGAINFTGDMPIILTGEGPTQGGFVCPFTIPTAELWKVGQLVAGDRVRFRAVGHAEALLRSRAAGEHLRLLDVAARHWPLWAPPGEAQGGSEEGAGLGAVTRSSEPNGQGRLPEPGACVLRAQRGDASQGRPDVTILQAGDRYVLLEYGEPGDSLNMALRARVHVLQTCLGLITSTETGKAAPAVSGMLDAAPAMRSLLVRYDPERMPQAALVEHLLSADAALPDVSALRFPAREIHLPIHLADRWTQAAVDQYRAAVRSEACYLPSNVEFLARNNGISSGMEACQVLTRSRWLVIGVGFYLGCPFAIPFDPRCRLEVPKYNPARTYTPDGAVGMGGPYLAIYPIECPGGYQLFGRTIPTWETYGTRAPFTSRQPWLLNVFDVLVFEPVSEAELVEIRRRALAGKYRYDVRETVFDVAEQLRFEASVEPEARLLRKRQAEAQAEEQARELKILKRQDAEKGAAPARRAPEVVPEGLESVETDLAGTVLKVLVRAGDRVVADETTVCAVEAMKMEVPVKASCSGTVERVLVAEGAQVRAGDALCAVRAC